MRRVKNDVKQHGYKMILTKGRGEGGAGGWWGGGG